MSSASQASTLRRFTDTWTIALLVYFTFVVYSSVFPFPALNASRGSTFSLLVLTWPKRAPLSDLITNVIAYIPLGFLLARMLHARAFSSPLLCAAIAALLGTALSFGLETLQQFLPGRVPSLLDLIMNGLGSFLGASLSVALRQEASSFAHILKLRDQWFVRDPIADLALGIIGLWVLSQLAPFVPSLDFGTLRHGLAPLWNVIKDPARFDMSKCLVYGTSIAGLAMVCRTAAKDDRPVMVLFFGFVALVLLSKVVIETRQLSAEALLGAFAAATVAIPLSFFERRTCAAMGTGFIAAAFVTTQLTEVAQAATHSFNWIPLRSHLTHTLIGISSILECLWLAAALAYLVHFGTPTRQRSLVASAGGLIVSLLVFGLEWHQQYLSGRTGDVTMVLLAAGCWGAVWRLSGRQLRAQPSL